MEVPEESFEKSSRNSRTCYPRRIFIIIIENTVTGSELCELKIEIEH